MSKQGCQIGIVYTTLYFTGEVQTEEINVGVVSIQMALKAMEMDETAKGGRWTESGSRNEL